jgi:LmbE family N-acetylglucosaminyl deacetylase
MKPLSRRELIQQSGWLAGATAALVHLPLVKSVAAADSPARTKLKVVVAGGHPDDPESGCGGTIARYADLGHEVVSLYLTRGEAGIAGKTHREAARIRTAECERACEILKCRAAFVGQVDGSTELNSERYQEFREFLDRERPDAVFTHWPVDAHRDHRAASLLVFDAWLQAGKTFALYYFEVMSGSQTTHFHPTDYVDITTTEPRKRAAIFAHASQGPVGIYNYHEKMNRFRGLQCRCKEAEAFIRHEQSPLVETP